MGSNAAIAFPGVMTLMIVFSIVGMMRDHSQPRRQLAERRLSVAEGLISKLSIGRYKGGRHPEVSFEVTGWRPQFSDFGTPGGSLTLISAGADWLTGTMSASAIPARRSCGSRFASLDAAALQALM